MLKVTLPFAFSYMSNENSDHKGRENGEIQNQK